MRPNRRHGQMTPYTVSLTLQDTPVFVYNVSALVYTLTFSLFKAYYFSLETKILPVLCSYGRQLAVRNPSGLLEWYSHGPPQPAADS